MIKYFKYFLFSITMLGTYNGYAVHMEEEDGSEGLMMEEFVSPVVEKTFSLQYCDGKVRYILSEYQGKIVQSRKVNYNEFISSSKCRSLPTTEDGFKDFMALSSEDRDFIISDFVQEIMFYWINNRALDGVWPRLQSFLMLVDNVQDAGTKKHIKDVLGYMLSLEFTSLSNAVKNYNDDHVEKDDFNIPALINEILPVVDDIAPGTRGFYHQ